MISVLPAGTEENQEVTVPGRTFELLIRQPAEFGLYASSLRTTDPPGAMVAVDPEQKVLLPGQVQCHGDACAVTERRLLFPEIGCVLRDVQRLIVDEGNRKALQPLEDGISG